jgi:hypothetical protein
MKKYTAEELMKVVKNLENEERIKFLDEMFYEYYNPQGLPRAEIDWD